MNGSKSSRASQSAQDAMIAARPILKSCGAFRSMRALPDRVLLHAGPAYATPEAAPQPVLNSAISAVLYETWANDPDDALRMILDGTIPMRPAQDHDLVTPLAFVATPGTTVLRFVDASGIAPDRFCPLNDGGADAALRFGEPSNPARVSRLRTMDDASAGLDDALRDGVDLLPMMAKAIASGDDLHGNVAGMTAAMGACLAPTLSGASLDYISAAPLFGLNPIMGACAVMMAAAATGDGDTVVAAGGNGVDFGWQSASAPGQWTSAPSKQPVGPLFTESDMVDVLPAIGDSAVIDACGFGGAILRHAPALASALAPFHPADTFGPQSSAPFISLHPALPPDIRIGLAASHAHAHPGIMLAMLDATGRAGLVGRGLASWPKA